MRKLVAGLSLSLASTVLVLTVVEVFARIHSGMIVRSPEGWDYAAANLIQIAPSDDPRINMLLKPNVDDNWSGIPVHINSRGLRGQVHDYVKPKGVKRILCMGDSIAWGWRVPEEATYCSRLSVILNSRGDGVYELINVGVPGWDQPIELAFLEDEAIKYQPDVIVAEVTISNDIYHDVSTIPPPSLRAWLREHTTAMGYLGYMKSRSQFQLAPAASANEMVNSGAGYPFPLQKQDPAWDEWINQPITQMGALARMRGAKFMVYASPTVPQVESPAYPTTAQEVIADVVRQVGGITIDPLPEWRRLYLTESNAGTHERLFADLVSHPSVRGHQLVAEEIAEAMDRNGVLNFD